MKWNEKYFRNVWIAYPYLNEKDARHEAGSLKFWAERKAQELNIKGLKFKPVYKGIEVLFRAPRRHKNRRIERFLDALWEMAWNATFKDDQVPYFHQGWDPYGHYYDLE